jgi:hypothetical protein
MMLADIVEDIAQVAEIPVVEKLVNDLNIQYFNYLHVMVHKEHDSVGIFSTSSFERMDLRKDHIIWLKRLNNLISIGC